ncbi:MAG: hypothetical protein ACPK85_07010 [Methanosarcina sp.]
MVLHVYIGRGGGVKVFIILYKRRNNSPEPCKIKENKGSFLALKHIKEKENEGS